MDKLLKLIAKAVESVAEQGAGAPSQFSSFQPVTPACLLKQETED